MRLRPVLLLVAATLSFADIARAADPTKQQCVDANSEAQPLLRSDKLAAAREQLRICAASACPHLVRDDCTQRLDELERVQPTLVFEAKDAANEDVSAVKVIVDGTVIADRLTGKALPVDPGEHDVRFEAVGQEPLIRHFVIHEGDKNRHERLVFKAAATTARTVTPTPVVTPPPKEEPPPAGSAPGKTQRIVGLALGGVGVVGIGVGAIFGLSARSSWSSSQNECASATSCSNHAQAVSDHDSALSSGTISTIAFIGGGVLLAGGLVLFFTAPTKSKETAHIYFAPTFDRGAGGAALGGAF